MVRAHVSVSLDGYVAGPRQSVEVPLGEGGEELHTWVVAQRAWREAHGMEGGVDNASTPVLDQEVAGVGAEIMGRGKFGPPGGGPWDEAWRGWWGEEPPFHKPVFVLTHHEREPLTLSDTTFTFVTGGIEEALHRAREAAGDQDVFVGAAPASSTSTWPRDSSTSWRCTSRPSCSAAARGCSTGWGRARASSS